MTDNEIRLLKATRNLMKKLYGEDCKCEARASYTSTGGRVVYLRVNGKKAGTLIFGGYIQSDFSLVKRMFNGIGGDKFFDLDEIFFPTLRTKVEYDLADMFGLELVPYEGGVTTIDRLVWLDNGLFWVANIYNFKAVKQWAVSPKDFFRFAVGEEK